ncbi:MAG: tRNA pseudouridine(55) synthase TruB [Deltaproteobacteria bacterium]|nr:tRNA pseudouridine(55) synthase TruB [Deltaproteobacteria bacterium]
MTSVDGILNINKPPGRTSFSVVSFVKRLSGVRRVGHAGTLDPAATGVLPVCLGQGRRVVSFLHDTAKVYKAQVELGVTTDSYDATGNITATGDPSGVSRKQLISALGSFRGLIQQTPPMYSTIKHGGRPLYELARAGIEVERKSRPVQIYRLELRRWQPPVATIEVECSKGTYIRSLAYDLGQLLGCGAHLKSLTRLKYGCFSLEDAVSLPQLEDGFRHGYWQQFVYPIDIVFQDWAAVVVDDAAEADVRNGRPVELKPGDSPQPGVGRLRVYNGDGRFLGLLQFNREKGHWRPEKVFSRA